MLTLGAQLLICLLNVSLQPWILQCNYITPSSQLIWIKIISIKGRYKQKNNNLGISILITILIIRTLIPSKYHHAVIKQQPDPSPNVTKESDILLITGYDDMVQHIRLINKSGPQEIFSI